MTKHGTILLIENDPNGAMHIRKALAETGTTAPVQTVNGYQDAVKYFTGDGMYANRTSFPMPFLVLLDLNIVGEDGFAILRWLYDRPGLRKRFSVLAFTSNSPDQEIQLAYELGVQSCLPKSANYDEVLAIVRRVKEYWIDLNLVPAQTA